MEQCLDVLFEINFHEQLPKAIKKIIIRAQSLAKFLNVKKSFECKLDQRLWNAEHKTLVGAVYHKPGGLESLSMKIFSHPNHYHPGNLMIEATAT